MQKKKQKRWQRKSPKRLQNNLNRKSRQVNTWRLFKSEGSASRPSVHDTRVNHVDTALSECKPEQSMDVLIVRSQLRSGTVQDTYLIVACNSRRDDQRVLQLPIHRHSLVVQTQMLLPFEELLCYVKYTLVSIIIQIQRSCFR